MKKSQVKRNEEEHHTYQMRKKNNSAGYDFRHPEHVLGYCLYSLGSC